MLFHESISEFHLSGLPKFDSCHQNLPTFGSEVKHTFKPRSTGTGYTGTKGDSP